MSTYTTVDPIFCSVPAVEHATFTIDGTAREALGQVLYTTSFMVSCREREREREGPDKIMYGLLLNVNYCSFGTRLQ